MTFVCTVTKVTTHNPKVSMARVFYQNLPHSKPRCVLDGEFRHHHPSSEASIGNAIGQAAPATSKELPQQDWFPNLSGHLSTVNALECNLVLGNDAPILYTYKLVPPTPSYKEVINHSKYRYIHD